MPGKSKTFRRKLNTSQSLQKVTKKVNRLNRMIEKKHIDTSVIVDSANDTEALLLSMNGQGDTSGDRDGLKIFGTTLWYRFNIQYQLSAAGTPLPVRFIVFMDKESKVSNAPAQTDLLESASTIAMYNNVSEGRRYKVLKDMTFTPKNVTTGIRTFESRSGRLKINRNVLFVSSSNAQSSVGRNHIYAFFISDVAAGATAPDVTGRFRLYYKDV